MSIVSILRGILLLFYGRTLYWVFIAVAGFLVGFELASLFMAGQAEGNRMLIALVGGVLGAVLGLLAQRIAFSIGGFFAGSYLALVLARSAGVGSEPLVWFVVGGIVGAIVAALVMDWAVVVLSSMAGAAAIAGQFNLDPTVATLLFVALCLIGIVVQGRRLRYATAAPL